MAFVAVTPTLARSTASPIATSSFTASSRKVAVVPARRSTLRMGMIDENKSIPQGFTSFSEQLNGRAAMVGFVLALSTELLTGKGIIGQLDSLIEIPKSFFM